MSNQQNLSVRNKLLADSLLQPHFFTYRSYLPEPLTQVAVGVQQQIGRLQIPVDNVCAVDILQSPEDLIQEVLMMLLRQSLRRIDDLIQVGFHEVTDDVHLVKV
mmetsp:Transcript_9016/g.26936  ORF Transcript_9016/g.26936 Transcript_9016/m.26936 type:complete len:104 (-) Transcript_9016:581-892(-)